MEFLSVFLSVNFIIILQRNVILKTLIEILCWLILVFNTHIKINISIFKISAPIQNDEVDFTGTSYSVSGIQDYFEYLIDKHETIADNSHIQIHVNKIKDPVLTEQDIDKDKNN